MQWATGTDPVGGGRWSHSYRELSSPFCSSILTVESAWPSG